MDWDEFFKEHCPECGQRHVEDYYDELCRACRKAYIKDCSCGMSLNQNNVTWIGIQEGERFSLNLFNCPKCKSTSGMRV